MSFKLKSSQDINLKLEPVSEFCYNLVKSIASVYNI